MMWRRARPSSSGPTPQRPRRGREAGIQVAWGGCVATLLLLLCAGPAWAQTGPHQILSGSITTLGTDCSVATTCVVVDTFGTGQVSVQLAGTWTGTVQFEGTVDGTNWTALSLAPIGSGAAVTSATGNGAWTGTVALTKARLRASALASGTVTASVLAR